MAVPLNGTLTRVLILLFAWPLRSALGFTPSAPAALSRTPTSSFLSPLRPATQWAAGATLARKQMDHVPTGLKMKGAVDVASVATVFAGRVLDTLGDLAMHVGRVSAGQAQDVGAMSEAYKPWEVTPQPPSPKPYIHRPFEFVSRRSVSYCR